VRLQYAAVPPNKTPPRGSSLVMVGSRVLACSTRECGQAEKATLRGSSIGVGWAGEATPVAYGGEAVVQNGFRQEKGQ